MQEERGNFKVLMKIVLDHSESQIWDAAKREWDLDYHRYAEDKPDYERCLCGHYPIRWIFRIRNKFNGNTLDPIGCVCIRAFQVDELTEEADLQVAFIKLGKRLSKEEVPFKSPYFTKKIIQGLNKYHVIPPSDYNQGDPENDILFLLKMFKRKPKTSAECVKLEVLRNKYIDPFLKRFYTESVSGLKD